MGTRVSKRSFLCGVVALTLLLPSVAHAATDAALWHMDEPAGADTMIDSSANGNNGTLINVVAGEGTSGTAYNFDASASASYVNVPDSDTLDPGTADFSFTASVKFSIVPETDYNVIRKGLGPAAGGNYKMEIKRKLVNGVAIGRARCSFKDGAKKVSALWKGANLADGAWHTITCEKTAGLIRLIVDGKSYTKSVILGSISNGSVLTLARNEDGDDQYGGFMDEVSVSIG